MENNFENRLEKILTEAKVMEKMLLLLSDSRVLKILGAREVPYSGEEFANIQREYIEGDENPYMITAEIINALTGEKVEFMYSRAGDFPKINTSATEIHAVYYDNDGIPCGSDNLVIYDSKSDSWENVQ